MSQSNSSSILISLQVCFLKKRVCFPKVGRGFLSVDFRTLWFNKPRGLFLFWCRIDYVVLCDANDRLAEIYFDDSCRKTRFYGHVYIDKEKN